MYYLLIALIAAFVVMLVVLAAVIIIKVVGSDRKTDVCNSDSYRRSVTVKGGVDIVTGQRINTTDTVFSGVDNNDVSTVHLSPSGTFSGSEAKYMIVLSDSHSARTYNEYFRKSVTIGRNAEGFNDATLTIGSDATLSSIHCRIIERGGQFYVEDLKSSNHTYLNNKRVTQATPIRVGDVLNIGSRSYIVNIVSV